MMSNPYQKYMEQSVSTMTPVQLVVKLYEKAETELKKAVIYIEKNNFEGANNSISRVQSIVDSLDGSLKIKYEISDNLTALYSFLRERLVQANIKKDTDIINELIPFFTDLKEAFTEVSRKGY